LQIFYSKNVVKAIKKLDKTTKQNIKIRIEGLTKDPPLGDIKVMQGCADLRMRLRVGRYRVIYKYLVEDDKRNLYIIGIGSRGDIYKERS